MTGQPKTRWPKASRSLIVVFAGCLSTWPQTQPADKPDAGAKPAPSPSAASAAGDSASPHRASDITEAPRASGSGSIEILSDITGVDFGPYLKRLKVLVQNNWYASIPESATPPMMKHGEVVIELAIKKDGSIQRMKMVSRSGDVALDRAAWDAITGAFPLPALPAAYHQDYLLLRTSFLYNPGRTDSAKPPTPTPQPAKQDPKN